MHYIIHAGVAHDKNPPGRGSGRYPFGSKNNIKVIRRKDGKIDIKSGYKALDDIIQKELDESQLIIDVKKAKRLPKVQIYKNMREFLTKNPDKFCPFVSDIIFKDGKIKIKRYTYMEYFIKGKQDLLNRALSQTYEKMKKDKNFSNVNNNLTTSDFIKQMNSFVDQNMLNMHINSAMDSAINAQINASINSTINSINQMQISQAHMHGMM